MPSSIGKKVYRGHISLIFFQRILYIFLDKTGGFFLCLEILLMFRNVYQIHVESFFHVGNPENPTITVLTINANTDVYKFIIWINSSYEY